MKPEDLMMGDGVHEAAAPPSVVIRDFFSQHQKESATESEITELARRVLLPVSEVQIWLAHLKEVQHNRKRGAAQAAITRKAKKAAAKGHAPESNPCTTTTSTAKDHADPSTESDSTIPEDYFCGVCGGQFEEETDNVEKWIACDKCDSWSHWTCVGISEEPEEFICSSCVSK
jgi:hypothetical protein